MWREGYKHLNASVRLEPFMCWCLSALIPSCLFVGSQDKHFDFQLQQDRHSTLPLLADTHTQTVSTSPTYPEEHNAASSTSTLIQNEEMSTCQGYDAENPILFHAVQAITQLSRLHRRMCLKKRKTQQRSASCVARSILTSCHFSVLCICFLGRNNVGEK